MRNETVSHVLQACPVTHSQCIKRHDHVVAQLHHAAKKAGWEAQEEPRIRGVDGHLFKPDLLLIRRDDVCVLEVAVSCFVFCAHACFTTPSLGLFGVAWSFTVFFILLVYT